MAPIHRCWHQSVLAFLPVLATTLARLLLRSQPGRAATRLRLSCEAVSQDERSTTLLRSRIQVRNDAGASPAAQSSDLSRVVCGCAVRSDDRRGTPLHFCFTNRSGLTTTSPLLYTS